MSCVEQYMNGDKLETRPCTNTPSETLITTDDIHHNQLKDGPSLLQKAANFAASMAKHVASGMPIATQQQIDSRFAICKTCEYFDGKACRQCGCPVVREKQFISKLSWANEKCPVGKWGPVTSCVVTSDLIATDTPVSDPPPERTPNTHESI